jgi:DNA-directed RNA polymerase subunit RPC12/RpoP
MDEILKYKCEDCGNEWEGNEDEGYQCPKCNSRNIGLSE